MTGLFRNDYWGIVPPPLVNVDINDLFRRFPESRLKTQFSDPPAEFLELANILGSVEKVFDAVAGLYVFHFADCTFKKEANESARRLRHAYKNNPALFSGEGRFYRDKVMTTVVYRIYSAAFAWLVEHHRADATFKVDEWGSYGYYFSDDSDSFYGDDGNHFPSYLSTSTLLRRISARVIN